MDYTDDQWNMARTVVGACEAIQKCREQPDFFTGAQKRYYGDFQVGALVGDILIRASNSGTVSDIADGLCCAIEQSHNTLQQLTIRILLQVLINYSSIADGVDLRNEASVETCKKIADLLENNSHLPFI